MSVMIRVTKACSLPPKIGKTNLCKIWKHNSNKHYVRCYKSSLRIKITVSDILKIIIGFSSGYL